MNLGALRYYVYAYYLPDGTPIYIGKGCGKRATEHLTGHRLRKNKLFSKYLNELLVAGIEPEVVVIMDMLTEQQAYDWEEYLIRHYGRHDLGTGPLRNKTDGGNGGLSIGYKHTPEDLEKIRQASTARWKDARMRALIQGRMLEADRPPPSPTRKKPEPRAPGLGVGISPNYKRGKLHWLVRIATKYICTRNTYCEAVKARRLALAGQPVEPNKRDDFHRRAKVAMRPSVDAFWVAKWLGCHCEQAQREAAKSRAKHEARLKIRAGIKRDGSSWRIKFHGNTVGRRSLYCDALKLKLEVEWEFHEGVPRTRRKRGDRIRRKQCQ